LILTVFIEVKIDIFVRFTAVNPNLNLAENQKLFLNLIRIFVLLKENFSLA